MRAPAKFCGLLLLLVPYGCDACDAAVILPWGDWADAVINALALACAVYVFQRGRQHEIDFYALQQASKVAAWVNRGSHEGQWYLFLQNLTGSPIPYWIAKVLPVSNSQLVLFKASSVEHGPLPPTEMPISLGLGAEVPGASSTVLLTRVTFVDATGTPWLSDGGIISRMDASAAIGIIAECRSATS